MAGPIMVRLSRRKSWLPQKLNHFLVVGPSAISFADDYPQPRAMSDEDIVQVEEAFLAAVERCNQVGCTYFFAPICGLSRIVADGCDTQLTSLKFMPPTVISSTTSSHLCPTTGPINTAVRLKTACGSP